MNQIDKIKLELGEIVLLSQLIESNLSSIILFLNNIENLSLNDSDIKSKHKKLSKNTLGNLSKLLIENKNITDTNNSLEVMEECRTERNFLIHELSSYHGYDFNTESGRAKVLERIEEGKSKMLVGATVVQGLMEKAVTICGGNPESMNKEAKKL